MKRDGRPGRAWTRRETGLTLKQVVDRAQLTDLEACREAWEARNPEGLRTGIALCEAAGGVPPWLAYWLTRLLKTRRMQRRFWARFEEDHIEFCRYVAVRAFRDRGLTWEAAYAAAAKDLRPPALGSPGTVWKSYKRVARRLRVAPGRYAFRPLPPKE